MMNFWISLYVSIVITVFGSLMIGSDGHQVQISRIGSHDQDFWTQDGSQDGPSKPELKFKQTAPDEQQSQDPGTNLTNYNSQVPDPPTGSPHTDHDSNIGRKTPTKQTPSIFCERPHEIFVRDPNEFGRQFPTGKKQQFPIILYSIQYSLFEVNGIHKASN